MTLAQAIKEGKFFRRPKHVDSRNNPEWQTVDDKGVIIWAARRDGTCFYTAESVCADDWIASSGPIEPLMSEPRNVVQLRR